MVARCLFCVRDARAGSHYVDATRPQHRLTSDAVIVEHLAVEKPRHGLQSDMRMWRHIHGLALGEGQGPEAIEKAPWPDKTPISHRQRAGNSERPEREFAVRIRLQLRLPCSKRDAYFRRYRIGTLRHMALCRHWYSVAGVSTT